MSDQPCSSSPISVRLGSADRVVLPVPRQAEEDRGVAVGADIGRAVHRHDALRRQQEVEQAEHRLLHLAGIFGAADQDQLLLEIDRASPKTPSPTTASALRSPWATLAARWPTTSRSACRRRTECRRSTTASCTSCSARPLGSARPAARCGARTPPTLPITRRPAMVPRRARHRQHRRQRLRRPDRRRAGRGPRRGGERRDHPDVPRGRPVARRLLAARPSRRTRPELLTIMQDDDDFGYALAVGNFGGDSTLDLAVGAPGEEPAEPALWRRPYNPRERLRPHCDWQPAMVAGTRRASADSAEANDRFGAALAASNFGNTSHGTSPSAFRGRASGAVISAGIVQILPGSDSFLTATGSQTFGQDTAGVPTTLRPRRLWARAGSLSPQTWASPKPATAHPRGAGVVDDRAACIAARAHRTVRRRGRGSHAAADKCGFGATCHSGGARCACAGGESSGAVGGPTMAHCSQLLPGQGTRPIYPRRMAYKKSLALQPGMLARGPPLRQGQS